MDLKPHASIAEFFHEVVTDAIKNQHVDASQPTEYYLVNLLATFATLAPCNEPLAIKLVSAQSAPPDERVKQLKDVGDTSLYVSGFFAESLERKLVDVDYYIQIGGSAYVQLSRYFRGFRHSEVFGDVFDELAQKFPRFVDVLAEISERTSMTSNTGVVQLYERWLRTGSERIAQRLREKGVLPKKSPELQ